MNLLLISVDSLRFDFVSRTNPRIHTPRFDSLSRAFCFSDRCFSVSSATRPVHTSLFTGLYPFEHGVISQRSPAMRPGLPHLFALFAGAGYRVEAFSEAAQIFSGLDYAPWIRPMNQRGVAEFLRTRDPGFLFLHYWGTHTPYGAADGKALGDTARLLQEGKRQEVVTRYQRAVERVFERGIAPILENLDLGEWMVLICGDHGESWTAEELYHGQTLNNSVLRVPLYLHLPHSGNPPLPGPLVSLVDVFATVEKVFGLHSDYRGYGRDLRGAERPTRYLAQLVPVAGREEDRAAEPGLIIGHQRAERQWALLDARWKFTYWEESGQHRLETTFAGEELPVSADFAGEELPVSAEEVKGYVAAYQALVATSAYAHLPGPEEAVNHQLDRRLRDLGYL